MVADPQIVHRGMVEELISEDGRRVRVIGNPMKFSEAKRAPDTYPPAAGEHTEAILSDVLNMTGAEIAELVRSGVVRKTGSARSRDKVA
jgi:crotonobetainyl-CoA:carnitine CoA-transferase CaiB-like acyl-CoA transferase